MKRYLAAALFLLVFGGLSAYLRYAAEDISGAIETGIIFALFAVTMFVLGGLQTRLRSVIVNAIVLIIMGRSIYEDFTTGDTAWAVAGSVVLIIGMILTVFENTPFIKDKIRPWLRPIPYIGIALSSAVLILMLILRFLAR